jgi:thiol-disulfide isomerase/thioredoxin
VKPPPPPVTAAPPGTDIGSTMPEYSAMWLDGSKFELTSKRDKVILLNVWATWCGPCRFEIPELQALHTKYAPKGFEVIGVSVDESGLEPVRQFVEENKMTYPIALDPEAKLATLLQTSVLPTSVLIDRRGRIVWKKYEVIPPNDNELIQAIEKAL